EVGGSKGFQRFKNRKLEEGIALGLDHEAAYHLVQTYGANVDIVFDIYRRKEDDARSEDIDPVVLARLDYAMEYELAYKPVDFFIRRTGALFFDIDWVQKHQQSVIDYMAKKFGWAPEQKASYMDELAQLLKEAVNPEEQKTT